jgi:hypothetical protein
VLFPLFLLLRTIRLLDARCLTHLFVVTMTFGYVVTTLPSGCIDVVVIVTLLQPLIIVTVHSHDLLSFVYGYRYVDVIHLTLRLLTFALLLTLLLVVVILFVTYVAWYSLLHLTFPFGCLLSRDVVVTVWLRLLVLVLLLRVIRWCCCCVTLFIRYDSGVVVAIDVVTLCTYSLLLPLFVDSLLHYCLFIRFVVYGLFTFFDLIVVICCGCCCCYRCLLMRCLLRCSVVPVFWCIHSIRLRFAVRLHSRCYRLLYVVCCC